MTTHLIIEQIHSQMKSKINETFESAYSSIAKVLAWLYSLKFSTDLKITRKDAMYFSKLTDTTLKAFLIGLNHTTIQSLEAPIGNFTTQQIKIFFENIVNTRLKSLDLRYYLGDSVPPEKILDNGLINIKI